MEEQMLTKDIIKLAKSLKRSIVEVTPHYICGSDSALLYFSIIYIDGSTEVDDELYYLGDSKHLPNYELYMANKHEYENFKPRLDYLRQTCQSIEYNTLILKADSINIGQNYVVPRLQELLQMKSGDGALMLNADCTNLFMSACSTMHPINKSDVMHISAYELDDISFIAKFIIDKGKYNIHEYVRFLYLDI